jgi:hypothetical protein
MQLALLNGTTLAVAVACEIPSTKLHARPKHHNKIPEITDRIVEYEIIPIDA